jgi:hypothetical protein
MAIDTSGHMDIAAFREIIDRHNLTEKWKRFASRFELETQ